MGPWGQGSPPEEGLMTCVGLCGGDGECVYGAWDTVEWARGVEG